jgi:hypothetical protein
MLQYRRLADAANKGLVDLTSPEAVREVGDYLCDEWFEDYRRAAPRTDLVETSSDNFSYLFDVKFGRLIAAWGISRGRDAHVRDKSRMARHPLGGDAAYHRGHAIPHRLGGGTDINLVTQKGSVNVGPFRKLENEAIAFPGSLYFTYWMYPTGDSQKPRWSQQGLLKPGGSLQLADHPN